MNNVQKTNLDKITDVSDVDHRTENNSWIHEICETIDTNNLSNRAEDYCQIQCRMIQRNLTLIYPNNLGDKKPHLLHYLSQFAKKNALKLLQNRRNLPVVPLVECRTQESPILALGVGILLQKTGLAGSHHLHLTNQEAIPQVDGQRFTKLLKVAAKVQENGKVVRLNSNRFLIDNKSDETQIEGFASKVIKGGESQIFSLFNSEIFRAIGYTRQSNFIFHVFAGGGTMDDPKIWGPLSSMTREPIHLRLYRNEANNIKLGLIYTSYTLDLDSSAQKAANWQNHAKAS